MCIGLLLSIFSCSIYAQSEAIPIHNYVNDYAGILSSEKEDELNQAGKEFEEKTGSQIVIITTDSLDGKDPMKVAADSGNEAGIGNKDLDNGVVILVSMEDKQRFVATGSGIQGTLSDIVTEHLQEKYLVPAFQDGDYEKGLSDLYYGIMDAIQYGVDQGELEAYQKEKEQEIWWILGIVLFIFVFVFGILGFVFYTVFKKRIVLEVGDMFQLKHAGWDFEDPNVVCISSDPEIASVSKTGLIKAKALGQVKITCINHDRTNRYIYVSVKKQAKTQDENEKYMEQLFKTAMIINSNTGSSGSDFDSGGGFSSGSGFSGGGGSFNGGGSGGSW
ncbi:TPM domain-containing protein [Dubosiella newyorkensis]|uniref:TPM domain-containing protein n=2 Tax=Dubosiella newyorkensis TaxID=1862672 RepID=A0A1U7NKS2_9FIRM|nr:TPM domain-containing protein [Dubosiella newyorkensis]OLU45015.1 hypothetical protein BO225_09495 [Dubosiella newyorkensis]